MNQLFNRQSLRLKHYDYSSEGVYFVTICVHNREHLFGDVVNGKMRLNEFGLIARDEWLKTETVRANVELDEFIVMPNHMHEIIAIVGATRRVAPTNRGRPHGPTSGSVGAIIGQFKSNVTKRMKRLDYMSGIWQRNYYERVIRNEEELYETRKYIQENPLKWDLDPENPKRSEEKMTYEKRR